MLETEAAIQQALNEAGVLATHAALQHFDTDGSPLQRGDTLWYSKGQQPCTYQTPYWPSRKCPSDVLGSFYPE